LRRKKHHRPTVECNRSYEQMPVLELLEGLQLDQLPAWASAPDPTEPEDNDIVPPPDAPEPTPCSGEKTIKIFLASSAELAEERNDFDLYFRQQNDRLRKQGIYLEIIRWENSLDAMSETCLQDEYNKRVRDCDIFVSLFMTKTGKFTEEEFDVAHDRFKDTGKPLIYTFFKEAQVSTDASNKQALTSLREFQAKLQKLGHFRTNYSSTSDLLKRFKDQLEKLLDAGEQ
jgi:hypothetical protein